jgi:hypothetical protein
MTLRHYRAFWHRLEDFPLNEHALLTGTCRVPPAGRQSLCNSARRGGNEKGVAPAKTLAHESSVNCHTAGIQRPWEGEEAP